MAITIAYWTMVISYNYNYYWKESIKLQLQLHRSWWRCNVLSSAGNFIYLNRKHKITGVIDTEADCW